MVRYRELRTVRQLEKEFPYQVEIVVPAGGMGRRLDEIEAWLTANTDRNAFARWGRWKGSRDVAIWGFRAAQDATAFAKMHAADTCF
jgi:hypothetical protein